jgi:hypothetical protein
MNIPYRSQDDLIGLGCRAAQIVDSIERTIRGSVEGTVWAAPEGDLFPRKQHGFELGTPDAAFRISEHVNLNTAGSRRD